MRLIPTILLLITFYGLYWLNYRKQRIGFLLLGLSAFGWAVWNLYIREYEQAIRTGGSGIISILTYLHWGKNNA